MSSDLLTLTAAQLAALDMLRRDPGAHVEAGTLGFLRRGGLVGKVVERVDGRQKTTSPITAFGLAYTVIRAIGRESDRIWLASEIAEKSGLMRNAAWAACEELERRGAIEWLPGRFDSNRPGGWALRAPGFRAYEALRAISAGGS